jgi:L-seryl-tRNA(Ser) seleniumtransferase
MLRCIPPVDQVLLRSDFESVLRDYPRHLVVEAVQQELQSLRTQIRNEKIGSDAVERQLASLGAVVGRTLSQRLSPSLRRIINATGVLLHTNAGRAPIHARAASAMARLATGYSNLEYDLSDKRRGHRDQHFESRVIRLLGCEAATVCNNNAAAVLLILNTLAQGKNVLVSRGELVEIGGSFRIPAIMEKSGAILREVGTTNKTRISDYQQALDDNTAVILRVHPSNYRIVGFAKQPTLSELVALAQEKGVPLVKDAGSGHLFPDTISFLRKEPAVTTALGQGVDLVCFSGDKLLGGPQAGLIVGRQELVNQIRKNPLMRAVRVDKVTYASLEETLVEYEKETYRQNIPIQKMMRLKPEDLRERAQALGASLPDQGWTFELTDGVSVVGGGSAPQEELPTCLIRVRAEGLSAETLERRLRNNGVPILARIEDDHVVLDLRSVFPDEDKVIAQCLDDISRAP